MKSVSLMKIPCGFKIRKKVDCKKFIDECMCNGNSYSVKICRTQMFIIEKDKSGNVSISEKRGDLNDIFNPTFEIASTERTYEVTVEDAIWQLRKYINARWFSDRD